MRPNPIPRDLGPGPFTRHDARQAGVPHAMLKGRRFVRVFPRVWRLSDHEMTPADWRHAARLSVPEECHLTGISRIQGLGLDFGPTRPLHFVRQGTRHIDIDIDGIFLHRTKLLAPVDGDGVTPAAAFLFYCSTARVIDAIKVGDWLLARGHVTVEEVLDLALAATWRDGAHESVWILPYLDRGSRSLKESETRAVIEFAGLPRPETNVVLELEDGVVAIVDLLLREQRIAIEYEGVQHQEDRVQYSSDLDRYALLRTHAVPYVQVTREKLTMARTLVGEVFRVLVSRGYDGPPPAFGDRWRSLFRPVRDVIGSRDEWLRDSARRAVG